MRQSAIILTIGTLVASVLPVTAQQAVQPVARGSSVEHAQLGILEAVGVGSNRVIIALPGEVEAGAEDAAYESYDTNDQTLVQGLGAITKVNSSLAPYEGNVVIVRYVTQGEHFLARRIDFTPDRAIHVSKGGIQHVDMQARTILLRSSKGTEETFSLGTGPGAVIDSATGLRAFSDLRAGQQVTVYFGPGHRAQLLWLA